ncbi:MAG TPA: rhomboid family intramembrane serine protease [Pyrinomonadaceae bacterium]|nr:rhomboid family intramembrane serine protease [Pyrinomonadaceae bacterium]
MSLEYRNDVEENEAVEENENVRRVTPVFPLYSAVLIACLVAVSLCQFAVDGKDTIIMGSNYSVELAGFVKSAFAQGEYWRILTGAVLHGGLIHLIFNCYALYQLGRLIEILSNKAHLAIVFLLAAIGGNLLSFFFYPGNPSVGASGGIVGFLGYLTIYGFKRRKLMPSDFLNSMIFNIILIAAVGFFIPKATNNAVMIDNFGHLGGLLVGIVYGFVQIPSDVYKDPREVGKASEMLGLAALGAVIAVSAFAILLLFKIV